MMGYSEGDFVRIAGEAGLYRVCEDRGNRMLLRALVDMPIQPTTVALLTDIQTWNGDGTEADLVAHAVELWRDCIGSPVEVEGPMGSCKVIGAPFPQPGHPVCVRVIRGDGMQATVQAHLVTV